MEGVEERACPIPRCTPRFPSPVAQGLGASLRKRFRELKEKYPNHGGSKPPTSTHSSGTCQGQALCPAPGGLPELPFLKAIG